MKRISLSCYAPIVAAALLVGCGGSQPPVGAPGAVPQSRAIAAHAERGGSWMLPEAKSEDLLYASVEYSHVQVYSYPAAKLLGALYGFTQPWGVCADKGGDVWITDPGARVIVEYAHGGSKPIATLKNNAPYFQSCSFDPVTGDLAVPNFGATRYHRGNVALYKGARGKPHRYQIPASKPLFCAYDGKGNLFVNGLDPASRLYFGELPRGGQKFITISLPYGTHALGSMQWDGEYLAVAGEYVKGHIFVYRFSIHGTNAKEAGKVRLPVGNLSALWVQGSTVIGGVPTMTDIDFWRYPRGGRPFKTLGNVFDAAGIAVSVAPSRPAAPPAP